MKKMSPGKVKGKHKFILTIGEEGCILNHMLGDELKTRLYTTVDETEHLQFTRLIKTYPKAPIYILINTIDQNYSLQTLPGVSSFAISGLINKRLERDLPPNVIKGAMPIGRESSGRKDWKYLFISTSITEQLSLWLKYITGLPNRFGGIYLLPIETENLLKRCNKVFLTGNEKPSPWQFLITYNKTGGIRQSVFRNQKIIFTRLIQPEKDSLPDLIAGNIDQEISNTNEYLRRLGFAEGDTLDLFIIMPQNIKASLETTKFMAKKTIIVTPDEASKKFGFNKISSTEDKFSDSIVAAVFVSSRPIMRFYTPQTKKINDLVLVAAWEKLVMSTVLLGFLFHGIYQGYDIYAKTKSIKKLEEEKALLQQQWKEKQLQGDYSIEDATKISNFVALHKVIKSDVRLPSDITDKLYDVVYNKAIAKQIIWEFQKDLKSADKKGAVTSTIDFDFKDTGNNLEELFNNFDTLTNNVVQAFSAYQVEYTKLPQTITFDKQSTVIDLKITVSDKK